MTIQNSGIRLYTPSDRSMGTFSVVVVRKSVTCRTVTAIRPQGGNISSGSCV